MAEDIIYNQFVDTADLYDLDTRAKVRDHVGFYVAQSLAGGGDVLEICCGTGAVAIPIAQAGIHITGLDISEQMLRVFRSKLDSLTDEVRERIYIVKGDMAHFDLHRKFRTIIIPFSSFQGLWHDEDIASCLKCVCDHLEDGGTFVLHCFKPLRKLDESWITPEEVEAVVMYNEDGSLRYRRTGLNKSVDMDAQIIYNDMFCYTYDQGELTARKVEHLKLKYYYPDQLFDLLRKNGFEVREKYGYYDKKDFDDPTSTEMVLVCGKTR